MCFRRQQVNLTDSLYLVWRHKSTRTASIKNKKEIKIKLIHPETALHKHYYRDVRLFSLSIVSTRLVELDFLFVVSHHSAISRLVCKSQILKREHRSLLWKFAACVQIFRVFAQSIMFKRVQTNRGYYNALPFLCGAGKRYS